MAVFSQPVKLAELALAVGGTCRESCDVSIQGIRSLDKAGADDLSFLTNAKYAAAARSSRAGALLVGRGTDTTGLSAELLVVEDAQHALAMALDYLFPAPSRSAGIHATAIIGQGCTLGKDLSIGPFCVVGSDCYLEDGVDLKAHVVLGNGCYLGSETVLYPRVTLYERVTIGQRCVIHAGAIIGADGFGYASNTGLPAKVQQVGTVVLGDDVEVGANSTIDRAMLEQTLIGKGTKIDNLVQVGHNAIVGEGCLLCAQVGVAGSAMLGNHVVMAGQSGVNGHFEVGDGVQVAAKSALLQQPKAGSAVGGIPAVPIRQWHRQVAALSKLGELRRRVSMLERIIADAES